MKIEKIEINPTLKDKFNYPLTASLQSDIMLVEKINEIIEALICPKCGIVKRMTGPGLCFDCDQEAAKSKK